MSLRYVSSMSPITHVELAEAEFVRSCEVITSFCAKASSDFAASLEQARIWRAEGRQQDSETWDGVPEDAEIEGGEEQRIAQDEEYPLIEGFELVGLFGLVYVTARFDKFLEDIVRICGWKVASHAPGSDDLRSGKTFRAKLKCIEDGASFSCDQAPVPVERVQEVFLARNDFVHNRGYAGKDYSKRVPNPRFMKDGQIFVDAARDIPTITRELGDFAHFIVQRCMSFSPRL